MVKHSKRRRPNSDDTLSVRNMIPGGTYSRMNNSHNKFSHFPSMGLLILRVYNIILWYMGVEIVSCPTHNTRCILRERAKCTIL